MIKGENMKLSSVVVAAWGLLLISVASFSSSMAATPSDQIRIRSVVDADFTAEAIDVLNDDLSGADSERTVRIVGRDGLCLDVKDGNYRDGTAIQLWPCSEDASNQLWTIKADRTIQSNGSCLTASALESGKYVMIKNCKTASPTASRWFYTIKRSLLLPGTGLVLSALSTSSDDTKGLVLKVERNVDASRQGWLATNETTPTLSSITGFNRQCLQLVGNMDILLANCTGKVKQKWAFYADGTIRPKNRRDLCVTTESDISESIVTIRSCCIGLPGQRWLFTKRGHIVNPKTRLVMDVKRSSPTLHQIIITKVDGTPKQIFTRSYD